MKHGNFWMTTIGAGVVIAGMMTAGRAALQSPAILFLAGQLKVAVGQTDEGMRLMNQAASQRENGTVHAAEPTAKPIQVCTKDTTGQSSQPRSTTVRAKAVATKPVTSKSSAPMALLAKLDMPNLPFSPSEMGIRPVSFDPATFRYLTDDERAKIIQAQIEAERIQRQRMKEVRRATHAVVIKYATPVPGFNPAEISFLERDLPAQLGQVAQ